eukprot:9810297-Prorocentrum_lima.AAC.1
MAHRVKERWRNHVDAMGRSNRRKKRSTHVTPQNNRLGPGIGTFARIDWTSKLSGCNLTVEESS